MIALTERQRLIIEFLSKKSDYITIKNMSKSFEVSERTIRNDLDNIEEIFSLYDFHIERKPKLGIKIGNATEYDLNKILNNQNYSIYTPKERLYLGSLLIVINKKITIENISKILEVSKNTFVQDLKEIEKLVVENGLILNRKSYYGISISGNEEIIRNFFIEIYKKLSCVRKTEVDNWLSRYTSLYNGNLNDLIDKLEEGSGELYSEEGIEEFKIIVLLVLCRVKNQWVLEKNRVDNEDLELISVLKKALVCSNVYLPKYEEAYLINVLRGIKKSRVLFNEKEEGNIHSVIKEILMELCEVVNIDYNEDKEFTNQITEHLKVAIHRVKNNLKIDNPMLDEIKYKMTFIYNITEIILNNKEDVLGVKFPETEIAYMAMYFEALFERSKKIDNALDILVVCNGGLATSSLLKTRINTMLPEINIVNICRLKDIEKFIHKEQIDFVLSTVPLEIENLKVIKVNPLLGIDDIEKIQFEIFNRKYEKDCEYLVKKVSRREKNEITKLIPKKYTQFIDEKLNWKAAIEIAAKPLVNEKKINSEYVSEIIKVIEDLGNYMVFIPEIAFVHATPKYVNENSISILNLEKAIEFGCKKKVPVKSIVVIANKEENMNLVNLINILTKANNTVLFKNARSYEEIGTIS